MYPQLDLRIGFYEPYEPEEVHIPAENKAWDINLLTGEVYEPDRRGEEWWLPYTYGEQEDYAHQNREPIGPVIIEDSQNLPMDFTGSQQVDTGLN